jgi:hypothetical protein
MGIDKAYASIRQNIIGLKLFKELNNYVSTCVTCQKRNLKKIKPPLQETDIPPFNFSITLRMIITTFNMMNI